MWDGLPSPKDFFHNYLSIGLPVVFRNALGNGTNSLRHLFSKDVFLAKYGKEKVPVSAIPYARSFGKEGGVANLDQVHTLDSITLHILFTIQICRRCGIR